MMKIGKIWYAKINGYWLEAGSLLEALAMIEEAGNRK